MRAGRPRSREAIIVRAGRPRSQGDPFWALRDARAVVEAGPSVFRSIRVYSCPFVVRLHFLIHLSTFFRLKRSRGRGKEMLPMAQQPAARPAWPESRPKGAGPGGGFTLMEVLVAVTILGVGFVALFGVLSGSLRTVSRIGDRETLVRTAQMKMNQICLALRQGREPDGPLGGVRRQVPLARRDRSGRRRRKGRTPAGLPAGPGPAAGRLAGKPGREPLSSGDHDMGSHPTRPMTSRPRRLSTKGKKEIHEGTRRDTKRR